MSERPDTHTEHGAAGCPFCDYAGPSKPLYEWEDCYAIEPLNPVTDGHVLVIPRTHVEHADVNPALAGIVFQRAAEIASGHYNLIQSNGELATQTVRHMHVHVVPRREGDGLLLPWSPALAAARGKDTP